MIPELRHIAGATRETATLLYWQASTVAPHVNAAPSFARAALQVLELLAAGRTDRIGEHAAARFNSIACRVIERRAVASAND
ncbi:hypothetical protein [Vineibacter terrae]|uniref:hypothetical protein n=1 Tax=Vineibacter terrae TaxID=2586908 RepID=UPI002E2F70E1|nr:hypothetical protein [Vineibacter terrae]HEX2886800.1 hypothetical protein [Vineibacter terrae]